MKSIFIFIFLLARARGEKEVANSTKIPETKSILSPQSMRIVSGRDAVSGERPMQVSLQKQSGFHFCGGSIVNKRWVVTAAHCTDGKSPSIIRLVVGTIYYKIPGQVRQAIRIIIHERYNRSMNLRNDISLIKNSAPFAYSSTVQPARLPSSKEKTPGGHMATVSGWGRFNKKNRNVTTLQVVNIVIRDQQSCRNALKSLHDGHDVFSTHVCANNPWFDQGSCNGDSGGPLTFNEVLIGLVSWTHKEDDCGPTDYPTIYTRVSEYVNWIRQSVAS